MHFFLFSTIEKRKQQLCNEQKSMMLSQGKKVKHCDCIIVCVFTEMEVAVVECYVPAALCVRWPRGRVWSMSSTP